MTKFNCAVVGLGNIGLLYDLAHKDDYVLTHTSAYLKHPVCNLLFGVDIDPKRRRLFERCSKKSSFNSLADAKEKFSNIDIISICVHVEDRIKVLKQAVALRPRLIFIEKPLAHDSKEARKIIDLCKRNKIILCVNYIRRFEKNTLLIKEMIRSDKLGKLLHVDVAYNGGFFNNASHYVDMLLCLIGKPKSFKLIRKASAGRDYDVDAIIKFSFADAYFKSIRSKVSIGEIDLWFEKGKIEYKKFGSEVLCYEIKKDKIFRQYKELVLGKKMPSRIPYVMHDAVNNICDHLTKKKNLLSNEVNGLESLKICEDILKSS